MYLHGKHPIIYDKTIDKLWLKCLSIHNFFVKISFKQFKYNLLKHQ